MKWQRCWRARAFPALLLFAVVAGGTPADPWLRVQSANFELFTTAGERDGRELVRHFEQVRAFFLQVFGVQPANGKPVRILAFHSEKEFRPYRPSAVATAFFHDGSQHDYIVMSSASAEHYQEATHEYTHLLVGQLGGGVPLWLNEGLAELYSTVDQVGAQMVVGKAPPGRGAALLAERWIGLDELVSTDHNSPLYHEKSRARMFYAESWALVHMLILDKDYRTHLPALLEALKTAGSMAAFQQAYGKSLPQVQYDLREYVGRQTLRGVAFRLPLAKDVESPEIDAHSGLRARLALAELLSDYPGKLDQAIAAYAQVARDYPQRWEVESALGSFAWRERRNPEAIGHFARAVELGATDARMFLDYGRALSVSNRAGESVEALRTAVRLDASLREAHYELGLLLVRTGAWREALTELPLARPVNPQQAPRYFYGMAYCEYRLGDSIAARNYLEQGRAYTKIPEEVAALERLSQTLGPPVAEGMLESVECLGKAGKLHVRVGETERTFVIPEVKDLPCGARKETAVRIEFQAMPLGATGADGMVRALWFQ